ncbi:MAG: hypothetical protein U9O78_01295 [Patescibacteria group bacterium]|nr:hypothetical protein [Patescibacteria group bacterium]
MRIKSPKNIVSKPKPSKPQQAKASFTSTRNGYSQPNLNQLKQKRFKLKAAEHASHGSLKKNLQKRGQLVGRRIADLQMKQRKG